MEKLPFLCPTYLLKMHDKSNYILQSQNKIFSQFESDYNMDTSHNIITPRNKVIIDKVFCAVTKTPIIVH